MRPTISSPKDPLGWCAALAVLFVAIGSLGLGVPTSLYFDEMHYVPAARELINLQPANEEHPLLAKEIIAASLLLFGDQPWAWRGPALLFGGCGLFAFGRLVWWTTRRSFATLAAMTLLATDFLWFAQSRIAMLDIFAAALLLCGLWQVSRALGGGAESGRHLALAGIALGLALGAKWSVAPYVPLPAIVLAACTIPRWRAMVAGISDRQIAAPDTGKIAVWLVLVPICAYWVTFLPTWFYGQSSAVFTPFDLVEQQFRMAARQNAAVMPHPQQSVWFQWVLNVRPVWYLYEFVDNAWRGVLPVGNPFTMLAGLIGLAWCLWAGIWQRRTDCLVFAGLYLAGLAFWIVASKPVQFAFHYLLPATFLMGCLALALDDLARRGRGPQVLAYGALGMSVITFAWFYPILSAMPLTGGAASFETWMWLDSWR